MKVSRARAAEWVLSQVVPPDRARSAVGDWMEDAGERGDVWFWCCVFRTTASRVWGDLTECPANTAFFGVAGFCLNMLVPLAFLALFIALDMTHHGDIRYRHDPLWTMLMTNTARNPSFPPHWAPRWPIELTGYLLWGLRVFQTGRWIARRAPGREVAGCMALALIGWLAIFVTQVLSWRGVNYALSPSILFMGIARDLVLFAETVGAPRNFAEHCGMMAAKLRIAEWILSQVLPPDRARSTAGDWMEDATERGNVWFWSCVFRTAFAHVWKELAQSPATMARLGLIGFGLNILVPVGLSMLVSFLRHGDFKYQHDQLWSTAFVHAAEHPPHWELRWQISLAVQLVWAVCVFETGRWIARRVPGREAAGCVAIVLTGWIVLFTIGPSSSPLVLATGIAHDLMLFAGALRIRQRIRAAG